MPLLEPEVHVSQSATCDYCSTDINENEEVYCADCYFADPDVQTFKPIVADIGDVKVTFTPFYNDGCVGYAVDAPDRERQYIYLNASTESDEGPPDVFIYQGTQNDPAQDASLHYYDIWEPEVWA
jgi:hypothetical protein